MARMVRRHYRTLDEKEDYTFSFEEQSDGTWLAFIERSPSYGSRNDSLDHTHRLPDGDRLYVCWDSPLNSHEDCMKVAAMWADCTQEYIQKGKRFGDG